MVTTLGLYDKHQMSQVPTLDGCHYIFHVVTGTSKVHCKYQRLPVRLSVSRPLNKNTHKTEFIVTGWRDKKMLYRFYQEQYSIFVI